MKNYIKGILSGAGVKDYKIYISGKGNFREKIRSDYKANRKDARKPYHYDMLRSYLVDQFDAEVVKGMEADDALGLDTTENTIIASIDKDLLMIPTTHYNFVKDEMRTVSEEEGTKWFYMQMLMGDKVDNILGIKGIGPKKAEKLLDETDRSDWDSMILEKYEEAGLGFQRFVENTQLLWILQPRVMPIDVGRLVYENS